jgi:muconate/chloromuconate cycloisomerase
MKITHLETVLTRIPFQRPHTLSFGPAGSADLVFVRVGTDEGVEGAGEAAILSGPYWSEESAESVQAACERYLAPVVKGLDPLSPGAVGEAMAKAVKGNPFARAAIEMACFDIAGQALGVPAYRLLGGLRRDRVPLSWSLATGDAGAEMAEAEAMYERYGISLFKIKVGHLPPAQDLARVKELGRALGGRFRLRVDANQGWDEITALRALPALVEAGVELLEQPVPKWNLTGMARIRRAGLIPVMADESAGAPEDVLSLLRAEAADILSLKVTKAGGLLPTCHVGAIAAAAGIPCYMGCMIETGVGTAAYLQAAAALPDLSYGCELFGPLLLQGDVVQKPVAFVDGYVLVPQGPGLGIKVDWTAVRQFARE